MSVPSKSIDKNKRYVGVKANDYVNKTRTNETSRATGKYKVVFKWKQINFMHPFVLS